MEGKGEPMFGNLLHKIINLFQISTDYRFQFLKILEFNSIFNTPFRVICEACFSQTYSSYSQNNLREK